MICTNQNKIKNNSPYCESLGETFENDDRVDKRNRKIMFVLVYVILFNIIFELFYLSINFFILNKWISSPTNFPFINNLFIYSINAGQIILYILYMKGFKAKKWEKIIFYILIFTVFVLYSSEPFLFSASPLIGFYSYQIADLFNKIKFVFIVSTSVFFSIFFGSRLKTNHCLWLLIASCAIEIVPFFTREYIEYSLFLRFKEFPIVFILSLLYSKIGSFFLLAFASTVLFKLIKNKRLV